MYDAGKFIPNCSFHFILAKNVTWFSITEMKSLNTITNNLKLKLSYHFRMLTKSKELRNFESSNEKK